MNTAVQDFSDDPIDGSPHAPDRLDRAAFAQTVATAINALAKQRSSTVIGLVGPWGSGKSSLIELVRAELGASRATRETEGNAPAEAADQGAWAIVDFNPWFFQDLPSLQWGFLSALYDGVATATGKAVKKVRETIQTFGRAIAPAGALGSLVNVDLSNAIRSAADLIGPDQSATRQQAALEKLLAAGSKPVLIVLDDLDRLSPDELLMVFKLIRLVGRLPFVHYLIAYDEDTLLDVLKRTGLVGEDDPHRASAYLEKMIQLRLDIPPLRQSQADALVDEALDQMARSIGLQMDQLQQSEFAATYDMHMRRLLATPRVIKRYVAQVEALYPTLSAEVDPVDFLLLSWLKVVAPRLHAALPAERGMLTGSAGSLLAAVISRNQKPADHTAYWSELLKRGLIDSGSESSVAGVLGKLFPRYEAIRKGAGSFPGGTTQPRKAAHPDYFDRYFALEVPADDVPDSVVDAAYQAIQAGSDDTSLERVDAALREHPRLIAAKLESRSAQDRNPQAALALLLWLAERIGQVPAPKGLFSPRDQIEGLCARLYLMLDPTPETITGAVDRIAALPQGLPLLSILTHAGAGENFTGAQQDIHARQEAYPHGLARYGQHIREAFVADQDVRPLDFDERLWRCIWDWTVIDPASQRQWLEEQFTSGRWTRLDTAARLVSSTAPMGIPTPQWTIRELDLNTVDSLVGLDALIEECRRLPELKEDERVPRGVAATSETRRGFVRTIVDDLVSGRVARPRASEISS